MQQAALVRLWNKDEIMPRIGLLFDISLCVHFPIFHCIDQVQDNYYSYGATRALISRGQSKARKRVTYFLTVFIINGFFSEC